MALRAADALVHPAQGISRGVVIKFGNRSYRLPAAQRVAVLTGNTKTTVRTTGIRRRIRLPTTGRSCRGEDRQCHH